MIRAGKPAMIVWRRKEEFNHAARHESAQHDTVEHLVGGPDIRGGIGNGRAGFRGFFQSSQKRQQREQLKRHKSEYTETGDSYSTADPRTIVTAFPVYAG
jgi:hypothetical protein